MGKRSDFERKPRDFYPTPVDAVYPLMAHIETLASFIEPCAGNGALANHIIKLGTNLEAVYQSDIKPQHESIWKRDALKSDFRILKADYIITNPPWDRKILHPMIEHFRNQYPTWLLFDADWMHTKQSIPYMPYCRKIVSVGRVKWIPGSKSVGKDNCAWYLFSKYKGNTIFYPRT